MEITDKLVEKLSNLARLDFSREEKNEIKKDLGKMIRFVEKINELDLTGTEPLLHMSEPAGNLRDDEVKETITREEALKNAPENDNRFFLVPQAIKMPEKISDL